jgi:peptide/nickel transport system substrate-binding protein
MRSRRQFRWFSVLAVTALFAAACGGGEPVDIDNGDEDLGADPAEGEGEGEPATGGVLVAALSAAPDQLDPQLTTASPSFTINEQIYETLVQTSPDLQYEPSLAEDWEVSDDGLTWTFMLREGVTWHNGRELVADDVVFTYERVMDPDTGASGSYRLDNVEEVRAPDDLTVEIELMEPSPNLLGHLSSGSLAILPQESVEADTVESEPVGTGPFQFVSHTEGSSLEVEAYEDYWGEGPFIEGVEFRFISEATVALTALETGEVDWTNHVPPQNVEMVLENPDIESDAVPSTDYWYYAFNVEREPFDDPQVREALAWGFDREALTEAAQFGAATPNQTAIPETSFYASDYAPYDYDPERAQQLLDEAGVSDLSLGMMVTDEFPETIEAAQILEAQWGELGVQVEIESVEFATWLDRNTQGDFDAKLLGWLGNVDPSDYYYRQHHSEGPSNDHNYSNPEVDRLLDEANAELDEDARKELFDQAVEIIVDENSYTYLYNPDTVEAWSPVLQDYEVRADGRNLFGTVRLDR